MTGEHERILHGICKALNGRDDKFLKLSAIAQMIDEDTAGGRRWLGIRLRQMASQQTGLVQVRQNSFGIRFGLTTDGKVAAAMLGYQLQAKPDPQPQPEPVVAKPKPRPKPVQAECTGWKPREVKTAAPDNRHPTGVAATADTEAVLSRATARTMLADTNEVLAYLIDAARQQMDTLRDAEPGTGTVAQLDRIGAAMDAGERLHAMLANATAR